VVTGNINSKKVKREERMIIWVESWWFRNKLKIYV